jgi:hypothetical protein
MTRVFDIYLAEKIWLILCILSCELQTTNQSNRNQNNEPQPNYPTMKSFTQIHKVFAIATSILFVGFMSFREAAAQTVAIGHVSAEVVEAVSASARMLVDLSLTNVTNGDLTVNMSSRMNTRNVEMGEIAINSGQKVACNVLLKSATVTDERGNQFVLEPTASISGNQDTNRADGSQNLKLTGRAMIAQNQQNGLYQGSYTMIFAYN